MFRYERPQAGRYRQFHQANVEALGELNPAVDAEVIAMLIDFFGALGLGDRLELHVNSIGDAGRPGPAYIARPRRTTSAARGRALRANARRGSGATRCACSTARCPTASPSSRRRRPSSTRCRPRPRSTSRACARYLDVMGQAYTVDPAARPRPRLLRAHHVRGEDRGPGRPGRGRGRRALRRPDRAARRTRGSRHRLRHRPRARRPAPGRTISSGGAAAAASCSDPAGRRCRSSA